MSQFVPDEGYGCAFCCPIQSQIICKKGTTHMTKVLNPNDLLDPSTVDRIRRCRQCDRPLEAQRSTKKFCGDRCRQSYNRVRQNAASSQAKSREQTEYYDRVNYAFELYNKCPQQVRDAWLQDYIDNPTTKKIVCNPDLLRAERDNIAKVCHHYVVRKYGVSIKGYY